MKKTIVLAIILGVLGFLLIILFSYKAFFIDSYIDCDGSFDLASIGQIGDFVGGFIGTIFSVVGILLLLETLSLQRIESSESKNVFTKQQFDNTFFELLKLHKENLSSFVTYNLLGEELRGRKFFDYKKKLLQTLFVPTINISRNRKLSVDAFQTTYVQHSDDFSIYFRTLYQLYSLIDKAKIKGVEQASYSKILRAQLSEGELFFIRYNAMTEYGSQSAKYINLFNILKHLSHFELLEFKDWWSKLNDFEKNGLGMIIKEIKFVMREFLLEEKNSEVEKRFMNGRYIIRLLSTDKSKLSVEIKFNMTIVAHSSDMAQGLDKFSYDEIENLFKCVLKEIIIYSNYNQYNVRRQLIFDFDVSDSNKIIIRVKNWMGLPLKIHYWYE